MIGLLLRFSRIRDWKSRKRGCPLRKKVSWLNWKLLFWQLRRRETGWKINSEKSLIWKKWRSAMTWRRNMTRKSKNWQLQIWKEAKSTLSKTNWEPRKHKSMNLSNNIKSSESSSNNCWMIKKRTLLIWATHCKNLMHQSWRKCRVRRKKSMNSKRKYWRLKTKRNSCSSEMNFSNLRQIR